MACWRGGRLGSVLLAMLLVPAQSAAGLAQERVELAGRVVDPAGSPLAGATVALWTLQRAFVRSAVTTRAGRFLFRDIEPGEYVVIARLLGFEPFEAQLDLTAPRAGFEIAVEVGSFEQELTVTAAMPEITTETFLPARGMEERGQQDVAAYLRTEPGVNAVRRGPINLEPVVRGLYEAQIGMFVDGTRTFAAGPARMDSDISHVSPHMLQSVRVVKGPYALTWGSGALSAIRVQTFRPQFTSGTPDIAARVGYRYGANGDANDGYAGLWGSNDRVRFTLFHNTRTGNDYTDGAGTSVAGDYESFDTHWSIGVRPVRETFIEYSGGYQDQNDIDYPGRILDATLFETSSHAIDLTWRPASGLLSEVMGQVYVNLKDHRMNNDEKPTAHPMAGRTPPFGLRIDLPATSDTYGGRFHVRLQQGAWSYKLGVDAYRLEQSATRSIFRRDTDHLLFHDIVWPDVEITNAGGYGQAFYDHGPLQVGATVRVDTEAVETGQSSEFFRANTTGALEQDDTNVSAAANAAIGLTDAWMLTVGAGRAVRAPTTLERYADRFPSTKFQVAAEFMGDPNVAPEASLELTAGTRLRVAQASVRADLFYRVIDDYITVMPDPSLPTRLPLSPPTVFRYVNGTEARFVGYDVHADAPLGDHVDLRGGWSFLWAQDELFDEPAFGIPPFQQQYALRAHTADRRRWVEIAVTDAFAQDRVAATRLEQTTDGWTVVDLRAGLFLRSGVTFRLGVDNIGDRAYATHLNSLDPFTGARIPERGRNVYVGLEYAF